jgi:hypothetical protein
LNLDPFYLLFIFLIHRLVIECRCRHPSFELSFTERHYCWCFTYSFYAPCRRTPWKWCVMRYYNFARHASSLRSLKTFTCFYARCLTKIRDSLNQQHAQQIDPTDIVQIPYNLTRLALYVLGVTVVLCTTTTTSVSASKLLPLTILYVGMMILSGASLTQNVGHTALAALYSTALALWDPPIFSSCAAAKSSSIADELRSRLRGDDSKPQTVLAVSVSQASLAGAVLAAILRLYDHGMQVQRWPVPVLLGSTGGWAVGVLVGTLCGLQTLRRQ